MDRIELLINTLTQQYHQKESSTTLLQTIAQLQEALTANGAGQPLHLGTAKIAVMMPVGAGAAVSAHPPIAQQPTAANDVLSSAATSSPAAPVGTHDPTPEPISVNERIAPVQPVIADALSREPIRELKKAIGINDRFLLIKDLFDGDEKRFDQAIKTIDAFSILADASFWIEKEVKSKPGYQKGTAAALLLDQLVSRRFS